MAHLFEKNFARYSQALPGSAGTVLPTSRQTQGNLAVIEPTTRRY